MEGRARADGSAAPGQSGHRGRGGAPRTLFGGLLRCGHCGGPMIAVHTRYGCAAHKTRGSAICQGTSAPRPKPIGG
ncbi:MAG: recombinase zinc beta ribbon domain-containing protein [Proteobacteria bacterium]|nr:recombinase zinc beta ribbon domain-containing protein [Pseudomonadota bacterium]